MAVLAIILISLAVLLALRFAAPSGLRYLVDGRAMTAVTVLPLLARFAPLYIVFAAGAVALILLAPSGTRRLPLTLANMDARYRLFFFCLPLLPSFDKHFMAGGITFLQLDYLVILSVGLLIAMRVSGVRVPAGRLQGWDIGFAAMVLVQLFMEVRGNDLMYMMRTSVNLLLFMALPYYVISRAMATTKDPRSLLTMLLLGGCVIAAVALVETFRHWLIYESLTTAVGADPEARSGYIKMRGGLLRPRATFPESTSLSLFLAVMLTMLYALRSQIGSRRLVHAVALLLAVGLFVTFARVGYLALVAGLLAVMLYENRFGRFAALAIGLPAVGFGLISLAEHYPLIAASIGTSDDSIGSVGYRSMLWESGLKVVAEHPFIGLDIETLMFELRHLRQGEGIIDFVNQPLTIAMRSGVVGFFIYFAMTIVLMASLLVRRRRLDAPSRATAAACFACVLALQAGLTTTSYGRNESLFILLLASGAGLLVRKLPVRRAAPGHQGRAMPVAAE